MTSVQLHLIPEDNRRLVNLCGELDQHLHQIEQYFSVSIYNRGHHFTLEGQNNAIKSANKALQRLYEETAKVDPLLPTDVNLVLRTSEDLSINPDLIIHTKHRQIQPRGRNQQRYIERIFNHDINFGIGPAGTGKTYLAVACAVQALERNEVQRILLVRPAVEAGERLGFLPGDLSQKVDPYLRPLYDALYEMLGFTQVDKLLNQNIIELAPLAYMRGRTLNDAFIILDESQNTTIEQMKMFLTRIGFGSTAVINGDLTQADLPKNVASGLRNSINILKDIKEISFTHFVAKDVIRHPLVQAIVQAYGNHDSKS